MRRNTNIIFSSFSHGRVKWDVDEMASLQGTSSASQVWKRQSTQLSSVLQ